MPSRRAQAAKTRTPKPSGPVSFPSQAAFRKWLSANHDRVDELILRCYRNHAAHRGVTYRQALDEALCFGWIDGVRRALDADSFTQRFTPRRKGSRWSLVNIRRVEELEAEGLLTAPGRAAFRSRVDLPAGYSFEQRGQWELTPDLARRLAADAAASGWFAAQAPWYRRTATFWVMSAKKEETRVRRFETLLERARAARPVPPLERAAKTGNKAYKTSEK